MTLETDVLEKIRPNDVQKNEVDVITSTLLERVRRISSKYQEIACVKLVGSVSKDTYVSKPDIDVFILFKTGTDRRVMNDIGLLIGKDVLVNREERYAEHPYSHGTFEGYQADIVPCYMIEDTSRMLSAVDRTPFHTEYVIKNLKTPQRDEVRLLKQFLKGIDAYGAEAKTQGFSGYLVELLILKYGSFKDTVIAASGWRTGMIIDIEGRSDRKFQAPMTFIDPVDHSRNVASALSSERFSMFVYACKEYLARPRRTFFFPNERSPLSSEVISMKLSELGHGALVMKCSKPDLIDDNLFPQVRKTIDGLIVQLRSDGFSVVDSTMSVGMNDVELAFLLESMKISEAKKHVGPPVTMKNSDEFLSRWRGKAVIGPYIEGGRWVALVKRENSTAVEAVKKGLNTASVGDSFRGSSFDVYDSEGAIASGSIAALSKLLDKRMNWEI